MKTKILLAVFFLIGVFANAELIDDEKKEHKANVKWDSKTIELVNIEQNNPVQAKFIFINKGESPVMINKVKSSCGCTVASYEKEPVMPGEKGVVIATYNAKRKGAFRKSVTVFLCDNTTHVLVMKGNVE